MPVAIGQQVNNMDRPTEHKRTNAGKWFRAPEQQRFLVKILSFDYTIEYKPWATDKIADTLSRKEESRFTGDTPPITCQDAHNTINFYSYTQQITSFLDQCKEEMQTKLKLQHLLQ